jgi:acetylornithine/N-succinyldiaminopimelate aminotransferase
MKIHDGTGLFRERLMPTYAPFPKILVRGEGSHVWDRDGKRYLDFCAGIAVNNLGHCHPEVVRAIREQAGRLMHVSNLYLHEPELELAGRLIELVGPGRVFFCQSGAEANETAIKLARKYARGVLGQDRWKFVTALHSFHGRTMAALTATGQEKYQKGFEPLLPGFIHVPYGDLAAAAAAVDRETCAILVEPLQGEGGVIVPGPGYLRGLRTLCDERGILLILDEVQTGFGRTGTLFAHQGEGVVPDIFTMAKSFGGGLPLGGAFARPEVAAAFSPGAHATTFGGNPVTCAAALAVLRVMTGDGFLERVVHAGHYLSRGLDLLVRDFPERCAAVRGRGLLVGLELNEPARPVADRCQRDGLLLSVVQDRVIRFTPPLIVSDEEIDAALDILTTVLEAAPE